MRLRPNQIDQTGSPIAITMIAIPNGGEERIVVHHQPWGKHDDEVLADQDRPA